MRDRQRPKVGEILVRAGVIDEHQLRAALGEQRRWGRPLGATLVKLGFIEEKELVRALASQLGLPMAVLDGKRIPPDVLALVPREVAEREMIIPLFVREEGGRRLLYVGVEDPGNLAAFDDLAFSTGMNVKLVMVGPSELCEAIDRCYHRASTDAPTQPSVAVVPPGTEELARHWSQPAPASEAEPAAHPAAGEAVAPPSTIALQEEAVVSDALPDARVAEAAAPAVEDAASGASPRPAPQVPESHEPAVASAAPAGDAIERVASAFALTSDPAPVAPPVRTVPAPTETAPREPSAGEPPADRSRWILRALAEILIEKGILTREELHARVRALERAAASRD